MGAAALKLLVAHFVYTLESTLMLNWSISRYVRSSSFISSTSILGSMLPVFLTQLGLSDQVHIPARILSSPRSIVFTLCSWGLGQVVMFENKFLSSYKSPRSRPPDRPTLLKPLEPHPAPTPRCNNYKQLRSVIRTFFVGAGNQG